VTCSWREAQLRAVYMLSKHTRDEKDEAMTFLIMILSFPEEIRFSHILNNFIQQYEHSLSLLLLTSSKMI